MSIKRTKTRTFGGSPTGMSEDPFLKKPVVELTFEQMIEGKADELFLPFDLGKRYEKGALIMHSKFQKGVVLEVEASKIEVLFADRKIKLGHAMS